MINIKRKYYTMRYNEFASYLAESTTKAEIEQKLRQFGFENFKINGNKINVLVQIPDGEKKNEFRTAVLQDILRQFQTSAKNLKATYSSDASLGSLGGIVFPDSETKILVKDIGKQGDKSAGVANEIEMASILQSVIDQYGTANIIFKDPRGKTIKIKNAVSVDVAGRDTGNRKKADVVIRSEKSHLPVSIKKIDADMWESADSMFGARAKQILNKLLKDGVVKLNKIKERSTKDGSIPVYSLSKEIVMEPTEEEAMNAIFGSDINPKGGVVIQTFKPQHFTQVENNIEVDCHAVIANKEDIPESHMMVWILRNDSDRNSKELGIAGIRPLGVTLTRGIGKKGNKDVILVDVNGNVVDNPNVKKDIKKMEKDYEPELEVGSEKATRKKRD